MSYDSSKTIFNLLLKISKKEQKLRKNQSFKKVTKKVKNTYKLSKIYLKNKVFIYPQNLYKRLKDLSKTKKYHLIII